MRSSTDLVFHALPEELIAILEQWLMQNEVSVVLLYVSPRYKAFQLTDNNSFSKDIKNLGTPYRTCLGLKPLETSATSLYGFMENNPDCCVIEFGALTQEGLRESQISVSRNNATQLRFWSSLVEDIKKTTVSGLWAINPTSGKTHFYKQKRYSKGAAKLAKTGTKLLPVAGWNYYQIEEP